MYSFSHWNRRLCLRPELTASVMRAFVGELQGHAPAAAAALRRPSFRYERPSRGRSRQFTQVGVELIGAPGRPPTPRCCTWPALGSKRSASSNYRLVVGHLGAALQLLANWA